MLRGVPHNIIVVRNSGRASAQAQFEANQLCDARTPAGRAILAAYDTENEKITAEIIFDRKIKQNRVLLLITIPQPPTYTHGSKYLCRFKNTFLKLIRAKI